MKVLRKLLHNRAGGTAAEFAMVLPLALIFLFGMIDAGRYMWEVNQLEKATQIGARWAVATDLIPSDAGADDDLYDYNFATTTSGILQGDPVPASDFPGVSCSSSAGTVSCACKSAEAGACPFSVDVGDQGADAFDAMIGRMQNIKPNITADNVTVDYDYSGLGFAGDPNGPDVAPLVTISLQNMTFQPLTFILFNADIDLPSASYSLTMEDGAGSFSN
jgi:TadE-like protein